MKKPYSFQDNDFIYDNRKNYIFRIFFILFIIGILIVLFKFDFYIYEENTLIKENDNYKLIVNVTNIDDYINNKYIYINKKKYKYKFIKEEYDFLNNNGTIYESIDINIPNYNKKNTVVTCHFLKRKNTLIDMIINYVRGG